MFLHKSVMFKEVLDALQVNPDGVYVDATAGGGGHSAAIAQRLSANGTLICNDRDTDALDACKLRVKGQGHLELIHGDFASLPAKLQTGIDGFLMDLGVSSYQLDTAERGFSYMQNAPLDMRMNREDALTARDIVNTYSRSELEKIFFEYGEERYARQIAAAICEIRQQTSINETLQLVDIIKSALPPKALREKQHPAKRVFQALRISVNDELQQTVTVLDEVIGKMNEGGRIVVLTFHSLEDRLVKNAFRRFANPCTCPPEFPVCTCGKRPLGVCIGGAVPPTAEEVEENPRARSAKMRVFEKRTR